MRCMILVKATTDSEAGVRLEKRIAADGPCTETKELIAGYTLMQARSREEALAWTRRFPNPAIGGQEGEIEVRQLCEREDFGPSEAVERFRNIGVGRKA